MACDSFVQRRGEFNQADAERPQPLPQFDNVESANTALCLAHQGLMFSE